MITVKDIYNYIDEIAPYSLQEDYDNSGINVRFNDKAVRRVLLALDVTNEVIAEAEQTGADLIMTHHPVIFRGLKTLDENNPAVKLCRAGISAISAHTNFDSAKMNDILCEKLELVPKESLAVENGAPIGYICECEPISAENMAKNVKSALGCTAVRYNNDVEKITKIAVCSGSGGSFLNDAMSKKTDCLITGDVKHDVFIDAHNAGICVIDGGHFHTENIFCEYMKNILSEKFPQIEFKVAENSRDILSYEF